MLEIRRNIYGEVPSHHFFIPMPVNQWRAQTEQNTVDLTQSDLTPTLVDLDIWSAWTSLPPTPPNSLYETVPTEEEARTGLILQSSILEPRASRSPTRSATLVRNWSWRDYTPYTRTRYSSVSPQRSTRTETRTCTPVCCCPRSFALNDATTGTSTVSTRTCKESGQSQSGSLI